MRLTIIILVLGIVGCASTVSSDTATGHQAQLASELSSQIDILTEELAKPTPDPTRCRSIVEGIKTRAAELEDQARIVDAILRHLYAVNQRTVVQPTYPPVGYGYPDPGYRRVDTMEEARTSANDLGFGQQ